MPALAPFAGPPAALPLDLEPVRDIEWFEGPILSELRDGAGSPWLLKFATCAEYGRSPWRFLLVRSTPDAIADYIRGRISMFELLHAGGDAALVVDYTGAQAVGAWSASLSDPAVAGYLPEHDAMHDPDLRPDAAQPDVVDHVIGKLVG